MIALLRKIKIRGQVYVGIIVGIAAGGKEKQRQASRQGREMDSGWWYDGSS